MFFLLISALLSVPVLTHHDNLELVGKHREESGKKRDIFSKDCVSISCKKISLVDKIFQLIVTAPLFQLSN